MEKISYPHRVRLYRGRDTHGARKAAAEPGYMTACDQYLGNAGANQWLPDGTPVTCPGCKRAMAKAGGA